MTALATTETAQQPDLLPKKVLTAADVDRLFASFEPEAFEWLNVCHRLQGGIYTRSGVIPAGRIAIGTNHRRRNVFHVARGSLVLWDTINGVRTIEAPFSEISVPGMRRIALALTTVEGSNIFETDAQTWEQAEAEMLAPFVLPPSIGDKLMLISGHAKMPLYFVE